MNFLKKFTDKLTAPEAIVQLKLTSYSVALGETLQGTLSIAPRENFESTEVRCEIACTEKARVIKQVYDAALKTTIPRAVDETAVIYSAKPPLSGPTQFTNGQPRDFPININIPAGARPTYTGLDQRVTWTIKGVIAVDGRPDKTTDTNEIQVIPPQVIQTTTQPTIQKETIRTIVMIPCKYCQALMDQTLTTCPNCGAKRTI